jgi:hypothetical protein
MRRIALLAIVVGFLMPFVASSPAHAQATRTWVSGVGDDVNPCSRTAPCKTFAGAISKTLAGGEISVLDPGGFGAVTITKSMSINADGVEGSILGAGTVGIQVNAGVNDVVNIRGLTIEGATTGTHGVRVLNAGTVHVSKTIIRGFKSAGTGNGVSVESANPVTVFLTDVQINNNLKGVNVHATGASGNAVFLERASLEANTQNTLFMDTANSAAAVSGSVLKTTPVFLSNGAQLNSTGNNFIAGGVGPTLTIPLK